MKILSLKSTVPVTVERLFAKTSAGRTMQRVSSFSDAASLLEDVNAGVINLKPVVSFQWKNPDFLLNNPDFMIEKNSRSRRTGRRIWR